MSDKFTSLTPSWTKATAYDCITIQIWAVYFPQHSGTIKVVHSTARASVFKLANATHTHSTETLVFPITSSFQLTTEPIWRTRPNQKNRWAKWVESTSPDCSRRYIAVVVWKRVFQNNVQIRVFPALFEQTEQYCRIRKAFGSLRYEINIFSSLNITKIDFKTA